MAQEKSIKYTPVNGEADNIVKISKILLLLVTIFAFLCIGVISLLVIKNNKTEKKITVASIDPTNLIAVEYTGEGYTNSVILKDGKWCIEGNSKIPFFEEAFINYIMALSEVTATKQLNYNKDDLGKYGLDNIPKTTTLVFSDKRILEFKAGSLTPDKKGYYIAQGERIFIVDSMLGMLFSGNAKNFVNSALTQRPVDGNLLSIDRYSTKKKDMVCTFELKTEKERNATTSICVYRMTAPFSLDMDTDQLTVYFDMFYTLTADNVISLGRSNNATVHSDNLYGQVIYVYKGEEHTICFYPIKNKDTYAVTVDDYDIVYEVSAKKTELVFAKPDTLVTKFIYTNALNNLSGIVVLSESNEYRIIMKWGVDNALTVSCNNRQAEGSEVRKLYGLFLKSRVVSLSDASYGKLFSSVRLIKLDGTSDTICFYESGPETLAVTVNGKRGILTDRQSAVAFLNNVKRLASGEPVEEII
jgi:hypothetical protein